MSCAELIYSLLLPMKLPLRMPNLQHAAILLLALLPSLHAFSHSLSLHLQDQRRLLLTLSSPEATPLSLELGFGGGPAAPQPQSSVAHAKSRLASLYERNEKEGRWSDQHHAFVETETDPKIGLSLVKGHIVTHKGRPQRDGNCFSFSMKSAHPGTPLSTCIRFEKGVHWFNAFENSAQHWPMEKMNLTKRALTPIELESQAVAEPYFLNSNGLFLYFNPNSTLFFKVNAPMSDKQFCVYAEREEPYYRTGFDGNYLNFTGCKYENAKIAQMKAVEYFLGKPSGIPDAKMVEWPIWTTWAKFKADIDHNKVIEFAQSIKNHGFQNSQMEIDDAWEICYGAGEVDTQRFPNMRHTIAQLNDMGFRTTMWVHPFVNNDCEPYYSRFRDMGYLVGNRSHSFGTSWWNSKQFQAGHFDFSRPHIANWYVKRLKDLQKQIGVDSYKFDAGESSFAPQVAQLNCPDYEHPRCLTKAYVKAASKLGPMIEFRTGAQTQYLPNYLRMLDRNSNWGYSVGLPTLLTTLLMLNIAGYPFVMPDMIGGNVYGEEVCTEEMFIRWTQANVFMPILQFSIEPWSYSSQAVELTRRYVDLHYHYSTKMVELMHRAVRDGTPINPPIWWVDPTDPRALACDDEFMLGEDVLVAPVLKPGATSRPVYLPRGRWIDEANPNRPYIDGPQLISDYPAPLDVLPYFTRVY